MAMLDGNIVALNNYLEREATAEERWDRFENTPAHKAMKAHRFETLLADPDTLWEAIGPDGIKYPFSTNMLCRTEVERAEIRRRMKLFDEHLARQIATLIATKDDAELGRIIRSMAEQYLEGAIDEWVDENWRDWA